MTNERTSKRVAKIAGMVLRKLKENKCKASVVITVDEDIVICTVSDLKALAASALTQAEDK